MDRSVGHLTVENPNNLVDPRRFVGEELTGRILLDGGSFERCTFQGAALIYLGGAPPQLMNCAFRNVSFEFQGAAGRCLAFLQALSSPSGGLSSMFKASFPRLFGH